MAADLVAAVAADAFLVVSLYFVIGYGEGLGRADADTFAAEFALSWIEDRPFYSQVLDEAEGPARHVVLEHGGIVEMKDKPVVIDDEVFCLLEGIFDCFPGL